MQDQPNRQSRLSSAKCQGLEWLRRAAMSAALGIARSARTRAIGKLERALEEGNAHIEEYARSYLRTIAAHIELEAHHLSRGVLAEYRQRVNSLAFNIARNKQLQASLCRRDVGAAELCAMRAADLATPEERAERERLARESLRASTRNAWSEMPRTRHHPCPRCSSRNAVAYEHVSAVRDIRKAETWGGGSATETEHAIRFNCGGCGHEWQSDRIEMDDADTDAEGEAAGGVEREHQPDGGRALGDSGAGPSGGARAGADTGSAAPPGAGRAASQQVAHLEAALLQGLGEHGRRGAHGGPLSAEKAGALARAIVSHMPADARRAARVRAIAANARRSPALADALASGTLSVPELCEMDDLRSLLPESERAAQDAAREAAKRRVTLDPTAEADGMTDEHVCSKCGARSAAYARRRVGNVLAWKAQAAGSSAERVVLTCRGCGHEWRAE